MKELIKLWKARQLPRLVKELEWRLKHIDSLTKVAEALNRVIKKKIKEAKKS